MLAKVDPDICIGCGMCCAIAADVFRMNDDGKAEAYAEVNDENHDSVQSAIDSCPVNAISWVE